jgi:predicted transcriptional regulator
MRDQLEQDLRRLITKFAADVRQAVLRNLQSVFADVPSLVADSTARATDAIAGADADTYPPRRGTPAPRRTLTADEMAVVRTHLIALIRQQPGQSTAQLARTVGVPSAKLRPQLRQLADEGVIRVDAQFSGGLKRHTYRPAAEALLGHHAELPAVAAGASA